MERSTVSSKEEEEEEREEGRRVELGFDSRVWKEWKMVSDREDKVLDQEGRVGRSCDAWSSPTMR